MAAPEMKREGSKQNTQYHCHQADNAAPKLQSNFQLSVECSQPQTVRYKSGTCPHMLGWLHISKKQGCQMLLQCLWWISIQRQMKVVLQPLTINMCHRRQSSCPVYIICKVNGHF